jgi:hypothetical protein
MESEQGEIPMRDSKKIVAWQRAAGYLTIDISAATRGFPSEEIFGLTRQIRKASYSVAANITEGAARESKGEDLHFLYIALARWRRPNISYTCPIDSVTCRRRSLLPFQKRATEHLRPWQA